MEAGELPRLHLSESFSRVPLEWGPCISLGVQALNLKMPFVVHFRIRAFGSVSNQFLLLR